MGDGSFEKGEVGFDIWKNNNKIVASG